MGIMCSLKPFLRVLKTVNFLFKPICNNSGTPEFTEEYIYLDLHFKFLNYLTSLKMNRLSADFPPVIPTIPHLLNLSSQRAFRS